MPNLIAPDVPYGEDESGNVEIRRWGEPRDLGFEPLDHVELGARLGLIDIPRAAKIMGSRSYVLTADAVYLEFALVRFALDLLAAEGFTPVIPPVLVKEEVLVGTRHYPFFRDQVYRIEGENLGLVGTSEIPLAALHKDEILSAEQLPVKYAGFSSCFRTEVGSGGRISGDSSGFTSLTRWKCSCFLSHLSLTRCTTTCFHWKNGFINH